jgi:two-component system sensor histidine kinase QseC
VRTNPFLLRAALRNVVENAIFASPTGSIVQITYEHAEQGCTLSVRDEGAGIPANLRDRVTDRFTRGHSGGSYGSGGRVSEVVEIRRWRNLRVN